MYYHFIQEALPRIILLKPFLEEPETKLLVFGQEYEYKWLEELGISRDQVGGYLELVGQRGQGFVLSPTLLSLGELAREATTASSPMLAQPTAPRLGSLSSPLDACHVCISIFLVVVLQVEVYNPDLVYCAKQLLVPTMSEVVTPPRENYELVREEEGCMVDVCVQGEGMDERRKRFRMNIGKGREDRSHQPSHAFHPFTHSLRSTHSISQLRKAFHTDEPLPASERDLVIYCSREHAHERTLSNEDRLLEAVQAEFPSERMYYYTGEESAQETVQLFRRAKASPLSLLWPLASRLNPCLRQRSAREEI
jgi:hypothetical protein